MKKIGFLICLLPLAACVVADDNDDETGADTEDSDSNASNSNPTSSPMTSGETDSQTSGMTEPDTTGETEEGSGSSSGGGGLGQCNTVCETYEDCCEAHNIAPENCNNTMLGGYECDENSECFVLLCADDMECQDYLVNEAAVCNTTSGACIIGCETIDDCEMIAMGVYDACDPDLGCIVEAPAFDCNEMDCVAPFVCDTESGACVECLSDDDCAASDYGPYCDTEINLCACMGDDDCAFELDVCGQ